jgi:hypothetical protein
MGCCSFDYSQSTTGLFSFGHLGFLRLEIPDKRLLKPPRCIIAEALPESRRPEERGLDPLIVTGEVSTWLLKC